MRGLFPQLSEVWQIPDGQCKTVGSTWDAYIQTIPEEKRSRGLLWIVGALPLVAAAGTSLIIFAPRFSYTLAYMRARRRGTLPQQQVDAFAPTRAVADLPVPTPPPNGEASLAGSGYEGERNGEFATIDGTENN